MKKYLTFAILISSLIWMLNIGFTSPPPQTIGGTYQVEGTLANGQKYVGKIRLQNLSGYLNISGVYYLAEGDKEKISSFSSRLKNKGKNLHFHYFLPQTPGLVRSLENLGELENKRIKVEAKFTVGDDGKIIKGAWQAKEQSGFSGSETWSNIPKKIRFFSISPNKLIVDGNHKQSQIFILSGLNFPNIQDLKAKDIEFLIDGKVDSNLKVREILEVRDGNRSVIFWGEYDGKTQMGPRDIRINGSIGEKILTVEKTPYVRLPLGGKKEVQFSQIARVYAPNKTGGSFTFSGAKFPHIYQESPDGKKITPNKEGKFIVTQPGWYYLKMADLGEEAPQLEISTRYVIEAELPQINKPWNFWYFPYVYDADLGANLWKDGEAYEKLDKVLGLVPEKDGWKKFDPKKHMDSRNPYMDIHDLVKKYYKNGQWVKPENPEDLKTLEKHNPTTIRGFAHCYLRSDDRSNRGWQGHCWGGIVATSHFQQPQAKTITLASGEQVKFTQEEVEGILIAYHTNQKPWIDLYLQECPGMRPTEKSGELIDNFTALYITGLIDAIKIKGLPAACNLRASSWSESQSHEVWNHVVFKFEAELKEINGDPTFVQIELKVFANNDIYPSDESKGPREESYTMRMKYLPNGEFDHSNPRFHNWINSVHLPPSYLGIVHDKKDLDGIQNKMLKGRWDKLVELFGYKKHNR